MYLIIEEFADFCIYIVEEFAVFCGPAYLHNTGCDDEDLVVPHAVIHLEGTTHALKRGGVTASLETQRKYTSANDHCGKKSLKRKSTAR